MSNAFISAALLPIFWVLMQFCIAKPIGWLAHKYLPKKIAEALTKKRWE